MVDVEANVSVDTPNDDISPDTIPHRSNPTYRLPILTLVTMAVAALLIFGACFQFRNSWSRTCDREHKLWTLVTLARLLVHVGFSTQLFFTESEVALRHLNMATHIAMCLSNLLGVFWFFYGIKLVFIHKGCSVPTWRWVVSLWSMQLIFCVPGLILLVFTFALICCPSSFGLTSESKSRPTPKKLVNQLTVMEYRDAKTRLGVLTSQERISINDGHRLEGMADSSEPPHCEQNGSAEASDQSGGIENKSGPKEDECPICWVKFEEDDQIVLMPCDPRHTFHHSCIVGWLQRSQLCPMCRCCIVEAMKAKRTNRGQSDAEQGNAEG